MQLCEYARESICTLSQPGGLAEGHGSLARPASINENKASPSPMKEQVGTGLKSKGASPHWGLLGTEIREEINNQIIVRSSVSRNPVMWELFTCPYSLERRHILFSFPPLFLGPFEVCLLLFFT